jgi:ABC-type spermidine/putrescine transport system permease subunit I
VVATAPPVSPFTEDTTRARPKGRWAGPIYSIAPTMVLLALFLGPMFILLYYSFQKASLAGAGGWTFDNYTSILTDPTYGKVMLTTVMICTISMLIMLAIGLPLAYILAMRTPPRFELLLLLMLVIAEELNPLIRIYAWRMILGRGGVINWTLQTIGLIDKPIDSLLFSSTAVVIVLSTTYISFTTIPIYAALKAVDPDLLEAADDLGASFFTRCRKILLPLAAPGIFVAIILVYIPLYSEFAAPALVGGTSGYMIGNAIQEAILESGNRGVGSAMSFMLLVLSGAVAWIGYRMAKIRRLQATS